MGTNTLDKTFESGKSVRNFCRYRKLKDGYLLTTDHGSWIYLSPHEFELYQNGDKDFFNREDLTARGFILNKSNSDIITKRIRDRIRAKAQGAGLHILVPTIRCNLRCIYCHSEAQSITEGVQYDMTEDTLKKTIEFIFQSPNDNITIEFQGGEPLQNKQIVRKTIELAEKINESYHKKYEIALVTNLLNLDEKFAEFLADHKDVVKVSSSLDGPREVHNKNRKYVNSDVGTYDQVISKLEMCREKGLNVGLLMVTTRYSLPYWKEIVDEYVKWGITHIQIKPLDYLGYAREIWGEIGYTMSEFVDFWKKCTDYTFELLNQGNIIMESRLGYAIDCILYDRDTSFLDWANPCGLLRGQIVYDYNGDIYCCDEARVLPDSVVGNVREDTYESVINKMNSRKWMESAYLEGYYCDCCAYKPFCGVCPVLHYGQEQNFRIKLNKTNRCEIHRAVLDYAFNKIINEGDSLRRMLIGLKMLRIL